MPFSRKVTAWIFSSRRMTSCVSPPMIRDFPLRSYSLCQTLTRLEAATPPKAFCFSTRATLAPSWAARTAAKTPVQLPPSTQTSQS